MAAREVSAEEKVDCSGKKEKGKKKGFSCTRGHRGNGIGGRKQLWPDWKTVEVTHRVLMCCREPRHLNCPFTMMARRLHSASHSSMLRNSRED